MIQILPRVEREPSTSDRFATAFSNIGQTASQLIPQHFLQQQQKADNENAIQRLIGKDISGLSPNLHQSFLTESLKSQAAENKAKEEFAADQKNYGKIKEAFGEKFADVWLASPVGARTNLTQAAIDANERGLDINEMLNGVKNADDIFSEKTPTIETDLSNNEREGVEGNVKYKFPKIPQDKGLKPNERVARQNDREKINTPFYSTTEQKYNSSRNEGLSISRLKQLNDAGNLPEGADRLNIDWQTGEVRFPAAANEDTQLFVKTINDFTTKAKDSYGGRVTNFELDRFLKRLPTLANTKEGRDLIISQMEIINELDQLHARGLLDTFDHYGIENINQQKSLQIANSLIEKERKQLEKRFISLDGRLDKIYDKEVKDLKKSLPKINSNEIHMVAPDGSIYAVEKKDVSEAKKNGYEAI